MKYLRQVNSFSQEQVAQKLGISRQSYIKYENGSVVPNTSTVHHLGAIYKVSESFIYQNKIPSPQEQLESEEVQYRIPEEKKYKVAEPEFVMKAPVQERRTYEGIFDGNAVRVLDDHNFKKGQRIIMWVEDEEEKAERRQKAWETILSMRKSVPNDFDYKKELMETLDEKYNSIH